MLDLKYFENKSTVEDREITNQFDFVRWLLVSLIVCPIRLLMGISYKVLLLGSELINYLRTCIFINLAFIVLSVLTSLFISKRLYFGNTFIPLPSLIVSLVIITILYFLATFFSFYIELGEAEEKAEVSFEAEIKPNDEEVSIDLDSELTEEAIGDLVDSFINDVAPNAKGSTKIENLKQDAVDNILSSLDNYPSETKVKELYVSEKENEKDVTNSVLNSLADDEIIDDLLANLNTDKDNSFIESVTPNERVRDVVTGTSDIDSILSMNGLGPSHSSIIKDKEVLNVMEENSSIENSPEEFNTLLSILSSDSDPNDNPTKGAVSDIVNSLPKDLPEESSNSFAGGNSFAGENSFVDENSFSGSFVEEDDFDDDDLSELYD